jgi:hypothetical protein
MTIKSEELPTQMNVNLTPAQQRTVIRLVQEVQSDTALRAKVHTGAGLERLTRTPQEIASHPLAEWHPALRGLFRTETDKHPAPTLPTQLGPWTWSPITFSGAPVGGYASLTLFQNGGYDFSGNFHVAGTPSYNDSLVWGVRSGSGILFTFSHSGHLAGTFEPGSRDDSWNNTGGNAAIAAAWPDLCAAWNYQASAACNWDIAGLVKEIETIVGVVKTVVEVVGALT